MAIYRKFILYAFFITVVAGDVGLLAIINDTALIMYINITIFSVFCFLFLLYLICFGKKILHGCLVEQKEHYKNPFITAIRRKLAHFASTRMASWFIFLYKTVVGIIIITYYIGMNSAARRRPAFAWYEASTILACCVTFYGAVVVPYADGSNLKLLGGINLILIGIFFMLYEPSDIPD